MMTNKNNNRKKDWQKIDARVLGQILAAQNIDFVLPDTSHIAEFFAETLNTIPGIMSCRACLEDVTVQKGEMDNGICKECQTLRKEATSQKETSLFSPDFKCVLADQPGMQFNTINSLHHHFGFFVFKIDEPDVFDVYKPFINNLSNYVALSLENRLQKGLLEKARSELELSVAERTEELKRTNENLVKEIAAHKQVEDALATSEQKLRGVFDAMEEALTLNELVYDENGEIVDYLILEANPAFEHMTGFTREQAIGRKATEIYGMTTEYINSFWKEHLHDKQAIKTDMYVEQINQWKHISTSTPVQNKFIVSFFDITELKNIENSLRDSEERYRTLFEQASDGIFIADPQGNYLDVNPSGCSMLGYSRDEILSLSMQELVDTKEQAASPLRFDELRSGKTIISERMLVTKSGALLPVEISGTVLDNGNFLGIVRNITERKQAEMQLHASEQLFRALVENSPDFIARYDREFRRIYVNPAVQSLFASSTKSVLGTTPTDQTPLYAPQLYIEHLRQAFESATENIVETPFRTAQGEMHWGHIRFVPEFDSDGNVTSVLTIGRDIQEVKESEQRFRRLAENFPDFVVRSDHNGRIAYVNPTVERGLGVPADAIVGKTLPELLHSTNPERDNAILALVQRTADEGVINESEAHWKTEGGEHIFEIRHVPEKDAAGNVVSVLSVARDVTERKQAEQVRQLHLQFLENMDQVNRAMQGANDIEQMMNDVLEVVLTIFECDRAWLLYPCDPEAPSWQVPVERTRSEYPGAMAMGVEVPMEPEAADLMRTVLNSNGPVRFGPESNYSLVAEDAQRFGYQSQISMAVYPKTGKPWMFGLHQCSFPRVWTAEEESLFQEIGRRLSDGLTSLLSYRDLQESAKRYRQLFENMQEGFMIQDIVEDEMGQPVDVRYIEINPAIERFLRKPRVEIIGKTRNQILGIPDPVVIEANTHVVSTGQPYHMERYSIGAERWYESFSYLFAPGQVATLVLDITERKQMEETLRDSEERYRMVFENSPVSLWEEDFSEVKHLFDDLRKEGITDIEAYFDQHPETIQKCVKLVKIDDVNQAALTLHMAEKKEELFAGLVNAFNPDSYKTFQQELVCLWNGETEMTSDAVVKTLTGDPRNVTLSFSVCLGYEQTLSKIIVSLVDITERVRADEKMLRSDQRLRLHSELSPLGFLEWDKNFRAVEWNAACERIFGYTREEAIGQCAKDLILPVEVQGLVDGIYHNLMNQTGGQHSINENITKDGRLITCEWFNTTLIDKDGQAIGVASVCRDITERQHYEREREAIITVSNALRKATTRSEILTVILDQVIGLFDADGSMMATPSQISKDVIIEIGRGEVGERFAGLILPQGQGVSGWVIANKKPYLNNEATDDVHFYRPDLLGDSHCVVSVPLIAHAQAIGALWLARQEDFSDQDLRLLNAIADIAANAIHRVTLHEKTEQQLHRLTTLHQIDLAISANFDLNITLNVILGNVKDELEVDAASILLLNPITHTLDYAAGIGFRTHNIERSHVKLGVGCAGWAAQEQRTVSSLELEQAHETFDRFPFLSGEDFTSHYATPLMVKGQVKGVLEIFHRAAIEFEHTWLGYFETLATQAAIAIENTSLFENLQRSNMELTLAYDATIEGWSRALDLRDRETEGHTQRVAEKALELAEKMGMSDIEKLDLRRGALLHDIGKMGIPDAILLKPGPLSAEEWEIMRKHPLYAYQMLAPITYLKRALEIPYSHHEKWDGSGYPRGLKGEEIPLSARVFAIVDVFDALISDRPYSKPWSREQAYRYIQEQAGKHFDPQIVEIFLESE